MAPTVPPVFRFAPSPNGYLHLGHAYSALLNFDLARERAGRFLLRIEDIDTGRARPAFESAIYEDLDWLELEWERPVRRQSEHFCDYGRALGKLDSLGLLYACDCRRSDIARFAAAQSNWPRDPDGAPLYPGTCRETPRLPARQVLSRGGEGRFALRLDMAKAVAMAGQGLTWREWAEGEIPAAPAQWGDVVLARKDTPASYHIAVVVDDALQGVTDVVRGRDLFDATSLHRLLQRLLDLPEPAYRHHQLVLDEGGAKLSKSAASTALRSLRAEGRTPEAVRGSLGFCA